MGNKGYIKIIKQFKLVFFYQKIGISVYIYFVWSISVNSILKQKKIGLNMRVLLDIGLEESQDPFGPFRKKTKKNICRPLVRKKPPRHPCALNFANHLPARERHFPAKSDCPCRKGTSKKGESTKLIKRRDRTQPWKRLLIFRRLIITTLSVKYVTTELKLKR